MSELASVLRAYDEVGAFIKEKRMANRRVATSLVAGLTLVAAASVAADDAPVTTQVVDALNKVYGVHPGFRANHAKGVVAEGTFKASPEARTLSRAKLFDGNPVPVTVRFRRFAK